MTKSLFIAASLVVTAALAGCSTDTTDETGSSSNDIVTGDPRVDRDGTVPQKPKAEAPLPQLEGPGADGTPATKKIVALPHGDRIKPDLDFPKPPVEDLSTQ